MDGPQFLEQVTDPRLKSPSAPTLPNRQALCRALTTTPNQLHKLQLQNPVSTEHSEQGLRCVGG